MVESIQDAVMIMKQKTAELGVKVEIDMNKLFENKAEVVYQNCHESVQSYYIKFDE